jgi:hypothetical protein
MSKKKSKLAGADTTPGFARGRLAEVAALVGRDDLGKTPPPLPKAVNDAVAATTNDTFGMMIPIMPELHALTEEGFVQLWGLLHYSATMGFAMALYRYADEVKHVPELATWRRKRQHGGDVGRATQAQAREIKYQRIRDKWAAMEAAGTGPTNATVAAAVRDEFKTKCSIRTVQRAFASPVKKATPAKRNKR